MKKYCFIFLLISTFIAFIGYRFIFTSLPLFILEIYAISCFLTSRDVEPKNVYKEDKEWVWLFIISIIVQFMIMIFF